MANKVTLKDSQGNECYPKTHEEQVVMGDGSSTLKEYLTKSTTEYNVSAFFPTGGTSGSNKYDLAGAIAQVPAEYRVQGVKITFLNESGDTETWEYTGTTWDVSSFSAIGAVWLSTTFHDIFKAIGKSFEETRTGLLTTEGTMVSSSWQYIDYIPIIKGEFIYVYIEKAPGDPYVPMQIYDIEKKITENIYTYYNNVYKAKDNGYIRICGQKNKSLLLIKLYNIETLNKCLSDLSTNVAENTDEIENLKNIINNDITKIEIPFEFQGYIGSNGQFVSHPNGKTTDFLSYEKINFTLTYELSVLDCSYINFYDENFGWLQELSAEYKKDETVSNKELIKPEGATYYRLTASPKSEYSAYFLSENYNKRKTIKKNINWVGHSIWWYDGNKLGGNGEVARGYQTLLKEQFNLTQVGNYCYSGHSLGGLTTEDENSILETATISTWKTSENAIWTLDTITNDFKRNIPIGTEDDYNNNTGITTYYGALRVFKDKIAELSGDDAIIICSNALRRNNSGYTSTSENTEGHTLEDYELALMTIASKNKWIFVDQFRMCGVTDNSIMITTIDGLHLNNFGYTLAVIPWIWAFDYVYNRSLLDGPQLRQFITELKGG